MSIMQLESYANGQWVGPSGKTRKIFSAVTGEEIAVAGSDGLDFQAMIDFAKQKGGPALRAMTFHDRARMLKALATYLNERREPLYELSYKALLHLVAHILQLEH
mgnify:CR=1 FL=1